MQLTKFEHNIQSQWGEDGVIQEIFKRIGTTNKLCVEFGAWDGKHLSNTWNLWHNNNWSAILIERDQNRVDEMLKMYSAYPKIIPIAAHVRSVGVNSLDRILGRTTKVANPDLISIDIDGDDYYIFKTLTKHLPRVIVIEYNPSIPPNVELVQCEGEYFGASARAIVKLAEKKGYKLAHITKTNLFFVINAEFQKMRMKEEVLDFENFPQDTLNYLISAYDGTPMLLGKPPYTYIASIKESLDDDTYQSNVPKLVKSSDDIIIPVKVFKYK